jgi:hypothetical protein
VDYGVSAGERRSLAFVPHIPSAVGKIGCRTNAAAVAAGSIYSALVVEQWPRFWHSVNCVIAYVAPIPITRHPLRRPERAVARRASPRTARTCHRVPRRSPARALRLSQQQQQQQQLAAVNGRRRGSRLARFNAIVGRYRSARGGGMATERRTSDRCLVLFGCCDPQSPRDVSR